MMMRERIDGTGDVRFVLRAEERGIGREIEWVLSEIELPDDTLSPWDDVEIRIDGERFDASLERVNSFGETRAGRQVAVECFADGVEFPDEFEGSESWASEPLDSAAFAEAWGDWLFPSDGGDE